MPVRFSVIIATYNRLDYLAGLLESWLAIEPPAGGYELILADDGSAEPAEAIVGRYRDQLPLRILSLPHGGVSAARQAALEVACGDFVLLTDDDCRPSPGLLREYEAAIERSPGRALGGPVVNLLTDNIYSETTQAIMTYVVDAWNSSAAGARFFTGSNLVFPRQMLIELGGFDRTWPGAGEDRDLCRRWSEAGRELETVPNARVGHVHKLNGSGFLRQHYHYGRGRWWCEHRRTRHGAGPPAWSGIPFYLRLLRYPFGRYPVIKAIGMSGLALCAQVATAAGSLEARRSQSS